MCRQLATNDPRGNHCPDELNRLTCPDIPRRYSSHVTNAVSSARERLVGVASRLFYAEGIHAVGVDRVIAEAGVAKATLYAHFASKDELVATYLARHSERWAAAVEEEAAASEVLPQALAPFVVLAERAAIPTYRGCPFINAAAEFPGPGPVADQIGRHRQRVRRTFAGLLGDALQGHGLVDMLVALYDGAMTGAYLDRDTAVVDHARDAGEKLLRHQGQW